MAEGVARLFDDPLQLASRASFKLRPDEMGQLTTSATRIAGRLRKRDRSCMRVMVTKITVERDRIGVELSVSAVADRLRVQAPPTAPEAITITIEASIRRTGLAVRLVHENGKAATAGEPQDHLVRLLGKARSWWSELIEENLSASDLASRHGVTNSYASRIMRLNFLAPELVEMILAGEQPARLDAAKLLAFHDLPLDWSEQRRELHII